MRYRPTFVRVDLARSAHNVRAAHARAVRELMAVVKADAYGHGDVPVARAALEAGATWLGVALVEEGARAARRRHRRADPRAVGVPARLGGRRPGAAGSRRPSTPTAGLERLAAAGAARRHRSPCTSRSTPACTASVCAARGRRRVRRADRRGRASSSRACGRTSRRRGGRRATRRAARRCSRTVVEDAAGGRPSRPRSCTRPTAARRSCAPQPTSTWCAPASRCYGIAPGAGRRRRPGLRPALSWRTAVSHGEAAAGRRAPLLRAALPARARRDVATVPVGYADGYPRALSSARRRPDRRPPCRVAGTRDDGPAHRGLRRPAGRAPATRSCCSATRTTRRSPPRSSAGTPARSRTRSSTRIGAARAAGVRGMSSTRRKVVTAGRGDRRRGRWAGWRPAARVRASPAPRDGSDRGEPLADAAAAGPRSGRRRRRDRLEVRAAGPGRADARVRPRVQPRHDDLALSVDRPRRAAVHPLRPARSRRSRAARGDLSLEAMGRDSAPCWTPSRPTGRSCSSATAWAPWRSCRRPSSRPSSFGGRVAGVVLIGAASSDLLGGAMGSITGMLRPRLGSFATAAQRVDRLRKAVLASPTDSRRRSRASRSSAPTRPSTSWTTSWASPAGRRRRLDRRAVEPDGDGPAACDREAHRADALPQSYVKYLTNSLREAFDLPGVPIRFSLRKGDNPFAKS